MLPGREDNGGGETPVITSCVPGIDSCGINLKPLNMYPFRTCAVVGEDYRILGVVQVMIL